MAVRLRIEFVCMAAMALAASACTPVTSGSGSTTSLLNDYKAFQAMATGNFTSNSAISDQTGTAQYSGVSEIRNGTGFTNAFLGTFAAKIDFGTDQFDGTVSDFKEFPVAGTSRTIGNDVAGSLALDGTLSANNASLEAGLDGTAVGSVDGQNLSMTIVGNVLGSDASQLYMRFTGGGGSGEAWAEVAD